MGQCCSRGFVVLDTQGSVFYTLRVNECGRTAAGCNACAPSCCSPAFDITVTLPSGEEVSMPRFSWPGWKCDRSDDLSNLLIRFPKDGTPVERAALLTGLYLIETAAP